LWKNLFSNLLNDCLFKAPATEMDFLSIKKELNIELPKKLKDLYNETNGVDGPYYLYFWPIDTLIKENLQVWHIEIENFIKPENLFLFLDAGNGDLFGYLFENGKVQGEDIYVWNHEDGSQRVIASSLEEFIQGWYGGGISI